ncbi:MAG TPA: M23 family metallopeptidase [Anaeromyxobacter sp.]|nr:M23 family metallopeptidase [Anaeromyxobacter sp.]
MLAPLVATLLLAAPAVELAPPVARPGDAVLVRVTGVPEGAGEPRGVVAERALAFWRAGEEWRALAALPSELAPGALPVRVRAGAAAVEAAIDVVDPAFPVRTLTVAKKFLEPPPAVQRRIAADRKAFARAYARRFAPPLFQDRFDWPRHAPTSGRYGDQRTFNGKRASVHYGLDVTGPVGAAIAAANEGEVVLVRDAYMSGQTVVLWHGADVYTTYFHLSRVDVKVGQRLRRGEVLGALGASGRVTGPHLHWGVKVNGLYVDPESILGIDFAAGTAAPRRAGPPAPPAAPPETATDVPVEPVVAP